MSDLAKHMEGVARVLWGEPNARLSSSRELRFGTHGARVVDLVKGVWANHEESPGDPRAGGGVLDLVRLELSLETKEAFAWLRESGFDVEDRQTPAGGRQAAPRERREASPKAAAPKAAKPKAEKRTIVRTYDYTTPAGELVYQVVRYEPKTFSQRRPSPTEPGVWFWGLDAGTYMRRGPGKDWFRFDPKRWDEWKCTEKTELEEAVEHGLYKRPELEEALADGGLIFLPEGEKDVETLIAMGAPATTNSGGAKHWRQELAEVFRGAHVVIPTDNDKPGRERADLLGRSLDGIAESVRILDVGQHWPACDAKGDITDWAEKGGLTLEQLYAIAGELPTWSPPAELVDAPPPEDPGPEAPPAEAYKPNFRVVMWADLDREPEPHEWLVKNLITRNELALLPGASQAGKSFVVLDLSMAIARGTPFLGFKARKGGVVYQVGEGYKGLKSKRLAAYRRRNGLTLADELPFAFVGSPVDLYSDDADTDRLIADVRFIASHWRERLELLVIDTLSAATPGLKENASEDISRVLKRCELLRRALGCTVLLVHHMNADGTKARGHTSLGANVENVITCRKIEDRRDASRRVIRELEVTKQKDGDGGLKIPFVLSSIELGRDEDGDAITSCTIEAPDRGDWSGEEPAAGETKLSDRAWNFLRVIERMSEEHGVAPLSVGLDLPRAIERVVEFKIVRQAFVASSFELQDDGGDPEAHATRIRSLIGRVGDSLVRKGLVGRHDRFLWRTSKPLRRAGGQDEAASGGSSHDRTNNLPATLTEDDLDAVGSWSSLEAV